MEEWRDIVGYVGKYQVSNTGEIKRITATNKTPPNHIMALTPDKKGYLRVSLYRDRRAITYKVHRLVAQAWIGECPDGYQVNHKDGHKRNNHVNNLEYATNRENALHARDTGLRDNIDFTGIRNPSVKLTDDQVQEIKLLLRDTSLSQRAIGDLYGVEKSIIGLIYRGKNWAHITIDSSPTSVHRDIVRKGENHHSAILNEDKVRQIRKLAATRTLSYAQIARNFGISPSAVSAIVRKTRWQHVE